MTTPSKTFSVALAPNRLSQVINPWSWTFGDMSLFTINLGQSPAPELETRILDQVGSYGRQLGRIGDALNVLLAHVDLAALNDAERAAIKAAQLQVEHVDVLKREAGRPAAAS